MNGEYRCGHCLQRIRWLKGVRNSHGVLVGNAVTGVAEEEAKKYQAALEEIANVDELVEANPEAFSIHAFKRCQEVARAALGIQTSLTFLENTLKEEG